MSNTEKFSVSFSVISVEQQRKYFQCDFLCKYFLVQLQCGFSVEKKISVIFSVIVPYSD